jgi:hypothetical protein
MTNPQPFPLPYRFHQIWFNLVGCAFGWAALWWLVRILWGTWLSPAPAGHPAWSDLVLGFVALVGISGYLPLAAMRTIAELRGLVDRLASH